MGSLPLLARDRFLRFLTLACHITTYVLLIFVRRRGYTLNLLLKHTLHEFDAWIFSLIIAMPKCLSLLLGRQVTLDAALSSVDDMLLELSYPSKQAAFYSHLHEQQSEIEALVSFHLGLGTTERCRMSETEEWMCGYYNVCVLVYVDGWVKFPGKRVIIRIPLPYKLGEAENPGNIEEKLRCEAATFIWIKEQCPEVPIPYLWGFGFPSGQCVRGPIYRVAVSFGSSSELH